MLETRSCRPTIPWFPSPLYHSPPYTSMTPRMPPPGPPSAPRRVAFHPICRRPTPATAAPSGYWSNGGSRRPPANACRPQRPRDVSRDPDLPGSAASLSPRAALPQPGRRGRPPLVHMLGASLAPLGPQLGIDASANWRPTRRCGMARPPAAQNHRANQIPSSLLNPRGDMQDRSMALLAEFGGSVHRTEHPSSNRASEMGTPYGDRRDS